MTALKLVSILHPDFAGRIPLGRLGCVEGADVTLIASGDIDPATLPAATRLLRLQPRRQALLADYAGLRSTLAGLDADVIHLHADPRSLLAFRVSRFRGPSPRPGLVLDCELDGRNARGSPWTWLSRQTLARADAVIARDHATLVQMRSSGLRGLAVVGRRGEQPVNLPERAAARHALDLPASGPPVFAWGGPLRPRVAIDLLEAVAACEHDITLLVAAQAKLRNDLLDRADALEILDRIRLVEPGSAFSTMLAAADALIVAPSANERALSPYGAAIGQAQCHGVPVVYADVPALAELAGRGGWPVRADDPGLLTRLLDELGRNPSLIAAASRQAFAEARERNSPEAAGAQLASAIWGVHLAPRRNRVQPDARRTPGLSRSRDEREASGT